jgi:hypothetical protein
MSGRSGISVRHRLMETSLISALPRAAFSATIRLLEI